MGVVPLSVAGKVCQVVEGFIDWSLDDYRRHINDIVSNALQLLFQRVDNDCRRRVRLVILVSVFPT